MRRRRRRREKKRRKETKMQQSSTVADRPNALNSRSISRMNSNNRLADIILSDLKTDINEEKEKEE
jgi:hypothetical protein